MQATEFWNEISVRLPPSNFIFKRVGIPNVAGETPQFFIIFPNLKKNMAFPYS